MSGMDVLVVGGGGREHALCWALARSPSVRSVIAAPGNGGTAGGKVRNVQVPAEDPERITQLAQQAAVDLVVVGPEVPLSLGLADRLEDAKIPCFGPKAAAAALESNKAHARRFMDAHGIPSPRWESFTDAAEARRAVARFDGRPVVKASGLAAGKGVVVADNAAEAEAAIGAMLEQGSFGAAGSTVVLEERLHGEEASLLAFCDGERFALMPAARDHKRLLDGDRGPNTGGMGAYAPAPLLTDALRDFAAARVFAPALRGMIEEGTPFRGVLYAGLMLTADGPRLLEFNCRFGDPETQVLMPLLDSDLALLTLSCARGTLEPFSVRWRAGAAATVVIAAEGYPGAVQKGRPILGLEAAERVPGVTVFHAGTQRDGDRVLSTGGRVLNVTGTGADLRQAIDRAYAAVDQIQLEGRVLRRDIGAGALRPHLPLEEP